MKRLFTSTYWFVQYMSILGLKPLSLGLQR